MKYTEENLIKKIEIRKTRDFTLDELLFLDEIINEFVKEDTNPIYKSIADKINKQVMEYLPL